MRKHSIKSKSINSKLPLPVEIIYIEDVENDICSYFDQLLPLYNFICENIQ